MSEILKQKFYERFHTINDKIYEVKKSILRTEIKEIILKNELIVTEHEIDDAIDYFLVEVV